MAQNTAPAPAATAVKEEVKTPTKFERAERLEAMRYRHLWIAYGLVWLMVFFFMFKTYRLGQTTAGELDQLKRRLSELEGQDGAS